MSTRNKIFAVLGRLFIASIVLSALAAALQKHQMNLFEESERQRVAGLAVTDSFRQQINAANFAERFFGFVVGIPVCITVIVLGVRDVRREN